MGRLTRVVHLLKDLGLGGTQKTAELFVKDLVAKHKNEYETFVLYNAGHELTRYLNFADAVGDREHMIPYRFDSQGIEVLQSLRPDITHVYRGGMPEWPIPGKDIKQTIFVETNVFGFVDPNPNIHKSLFMSKWLMNCSKQQHGDAIFDTVGRTGRFDFINNPVDLPVSQEVFLGLRPDHETVILGRVGRPDDGIYDDINVKAAMVLVNKGFKIFFLTLAAPPRMIEDMEKYGVPYHNMAPTVDAHTLSTFYNTIDILAHARADGETFGSNIAEAMMHGKPVVTHVAVPSHPRMGVFQAQTELVQDDITGYVVPHDVPAYAFALEQLITIAPLRKKLGTTGREWAEKNCSTEACGAKLHQTYQDLLYRYAHQIRSRS